MHESPKYQPESSTVMSMAAQDHPVPEQAINDQLVRLLQSSIFAASERLCRFLRFTIESTAAGGANSLKECVVGHKVYDRIATYDSRQDSIVRTEARRLRGKLKEYYETVGRTDPVIISYHPGSYVPSFYWREHLPTQGDGHSFPEPPETPSWSRGSDVTIAILPFVNASEDAYVAECARDLTDELTHLCMHTEGIRIIDAAGFSQPNEPMLSTPLMARKLGVQAIYCGTVRGEDQHLRVISRLVKADGYQISSQRFDVGADLHGRFALTEHLASAIINRTRPQISEIQKESVSGGGALPANYQAFLAAEALLDEGTVPSLQTALARFHEITSFTPIHARSFSGMAECHHQLALCGIRGSATAVGRSGEAALRAITLDPESSSCHANLAWAAALAWDWHTAESHFQGILRVGATAGGYRLYAQYLMISGNYDEASYYLQKAQQMDAFSNRQRIAYAMLLHLDARAEDALPSFDGPLRFEPLSIEAQLYLALIYLRHGEPGRAKQIAEKVRGQTASQPNLVAFTAEVLAVCGDRGQSMHLAQQSKLLCPASPISYFKQALLTLALGDRDHALTLLTTAAQEREAELIWLAVEPRFASLRDHPHFVHLLRCVRPDTSSNEMDGNILEMGKPHDHQTIFRMVSTKR